MEFSQLHSVVKKLKPDGFHDLPEMTQLVRDSAGTRKLIALALRPEPLHGTCSTSDCIRNQRSNSHFHLVSVLGRKRSEKRYHHRFLRGWGGGVHVERREGRGKGSQTRL